jgi:hypothetical protein
MQRCRVRHALIAGTSRQVAVMLWHSVCRQDMLSRYTHSMGCASCTCSPSLWLSTCKLASSACIGATHTQPGLRFCLVDAIRVWDPAPSLGPARPAVRTWHSVYNCTFGPSIECVIVLHGCSHTGCCTSTVCDPTQGFCQEQVECCVLHGCMMATMATCIAFAAHHLAPAGRRRAAWLPALVVPLV